MCSSNIPNKKYLLVGGTGTLGNATIKALLGMNKEADITVLSRDEFKQKMLKQRYPTVKAFLGDIRDLGWCANYYNGIDTVFHFAAQKHVDIAELNPDESIKTNILGTINSAKAAMTAGCKNFIFTSSDKAVLPINIYGYCKGASEKFLQNLNDIQSKTKFLIFRWGNVCGSRGSVVDWFIETLTRESAVYITSPKMTRFWININDAVKFMLDSIDSHDGKEIIFPDMKASSVTCLADAVARYLDIGTYETKITGIRPGEKLHECLFTSHDVCIRSDTAEKFTPSELLELIKRSQEDE